MKWRAILRIEGEVVKSAHVITTEQQWQDELEVGMAESLLGGVWVPVEVDEDDVYPF